MKRIITALVLTLLTAGVFPASAEDKALLYEISGKGLTQPSYLYGTFHLVCPTDLRLTDATQKALSNAKQVYLEIDLDEPSAESAIMQAMMFTDGKTLKDFLKPDDYEVLESYIQRTSGLPLARMGGLKPIALMSLMFASMLKCEPVSYDSTFAQMAGKAGKEVLGLETLEEQVAVLDRLPIEEQLKGLVDIARNPDKAHKEFMDLISAYKAQDVPLLMKLIHDSEFEGDTADFDEAVLNKRNAKWIPIIEKAAQAKSTFFAFGAGHLGGEKGVVSLLRERGYTIKAMP